MATMENRGGRRLPNNLDAERGLLGIIMVKNDALFEVVEHVTKADFFEPAHGELFTLMRDMIEANRVAVPNTIMHDYSQDADIGGVRASEYLQRLFNDAPPVSVAFNFARAIADLALKRRLIAAAEVMIRETWSAPVSLTGAELRTRYDAAFEGLFASAGDVGVKRLGDIGRQVIEEIASAVQKGRAIGIPTGIVALENIIGPLMPGRVYSLFGSPGAGKSKLVQQVGEFAATEYEGVSKKVLMFSLEMKANEIAERGLSALSGVSSAAIERVQIDAEDYAKLVDANARQTPLDFYIDDATGQTIGNIRSKAIRQKRLIGLDLLIIDNMLYIKRDQKQGEFDGIRTNMQEVKRLAKDLSIPVMIIGHLKKEYADGPIRPPTSGDIYGGSAPEQESDVVLFIYREEYMLRRKAPPKDTPEHAVWAQRLEMVEGVAQFITEKCRGGAGNQMREAFFDGAQGFSDQPFRRARTPLSPDLLSYADTL